MAVAMEVPTKDRQWYIVGRWQEYEGEGRANLLRIVAIGAFYLVQLFQFYVVGKSDPALLPFHQRATAIAAAWTMVALLVLLCLRRHIFPAALKYGSTACDIILLTALAWLAGGPTSSLTRVFFLIIAMSALRFNLGLVWFSTLGCMLAYEGLVGAADKTWFDADHVIPPVENLIVLLSLGLTGIVIGQVIRRVRALADDYAHRLGKARAI
jgi:hypothetical protein